MSATIQAEAARQDTGPTRVAYLGPEGTFTHQAALDMAPKDALLDPLPQVTDVYEQVESGRARYGIVAIESTVEGYVVPSLDALVAATNVVAVEEAFVDISFDAFELPGASEPKTQIVAHPVGLAQCKGFIARRGLEVVSATSNAAACRDIEPHQIALGPRVCGTLYGLNTVEQSVSDFVGARTRFLLITGRDEAATHLEELRAHGAHAGSRVMRSMLAVTPRATGPGVLARISGALGQRGVNMSSLITRPLKALEGKYTFIVTLDAAPWDDNLHAVIRGLLEAGDAVKTLGVFPARGEIDDSIDESRIAPLSAHLTSSTEDLRRALLW